MTSNTKLTQIQCEKVVQNNVDFYIGKLKAEEFLDIASVTHRIITGWDEKNQPIYNNHVQRKPNQSRVTAVKNFLLKDEIACFPNSILVALPSTLLVEEIDDNNPVLKIDKSLIKLDSEEPIYVQIIDGQHRFKGLKDAIKELERKNEEEREWLEEDNEKLESLLNFEFVISFFIDPDIDFQAMLFSVINRTPVKVNQDLVYDLFGILEKDSPQKTSLAIALELNGHKIKGRKGPFFKRIRLLGKKEKGENSPISQGMFIKTILKLISPSLRLSEIERFKSRESFKEGGNENTIFRTYYAENQDNLIFKVLSNYFDAVRNTFVDNNGRSYWDLEETRENPFHKTIGFLALVDVLIELFPIGLKEKKLTTEFFELWLGKAKDIELIDANGNTNYPYSSKGKTELSDDLISRIL